jgi:hypothetical protein
LNVTLQESAVLWTFLPGDKDVVYEIFYQEYLGDSPEFSIEEVGRFF